MDWDESGETLTRVDASTFLSRGKSEIPASRMEIEESRREREERREVTEALSDWRDCDCAILLADVGIETGDMAFVFGDVVWIWS